MRPQTAFFARTRRRPQAPPLFPYTTLFRSRAPAALHDHQRRVRLAHAGEVEEVRLLKEGDVILERLAAAKGDDGRSEEHTSELQSRLHLVCRLLLEKNKLR